MASNSYNRDLPNPDAAFPRNAVVDETAKLQQTGQHGIGGFGASDIARTDKESISTSTPSTLSHQSSVPSSSAFNNDTVSTSTSSQDSTVTHLVHDAEEVAAQALHAASNVASNLFGAAASYLPSAEQTKETASVAAARTQETAASTANSVSQSLPTQNEVKGAAVQTSNYASQATNEAASRLPSVQDVRDTAAGAIRSVANAIPSAEQVENNVSANTPSSIQPVRETTHAPTSGLTTTSASVSPSSTLPHSNQPGTNNPFLHSSAASASSPNAAGQQVGGMAGVISDSIARAAEESPATSAGSNVGPGYGSGSGRAGEGVASKPGEVNQVGGLAGVIAEDVAQAAQHSTATSVGDVPLASSQTAPSVTENISQSLPSQQQVRGTLNQAAESANETAHQAANTVARSLPSENQVRGAANEGINYASDAATQVSSVLPSVQDIRNTAANAIRSVAGALPSGEQVEQTAESATQQVRDTTNSVAQSARDTTNAATQQAQNTASSLGQQARDTTQQARSAVAPPTFSTRESSMETPGTVKILDRQVIGGPTGEASRPAPVSYTPISAADDNAAFRSAVGTQGGQLTPGGITPGQELPGGWGHTNVVRPETTIYEDAERLLKSVGQVAYSSIPHSLIEKFSNHSIRDDHPISTTTNTLPHQSTTTNTTGSIIPSTEQVQNAIENAKAVIASHLPSGQRIQETADNAAYNAGKAAGAVSVTGQQAAQQTREATAQGVQSARDSVVGTAEQARDSASSVAGQARDSASGMTEQARQTAAGGIRSAADALPSDEQVRQAVPSPSQIIPTSGDATNNRSLASTELPSLSTITHSATDALHNAAAYLGLGSPTKATSSTGERDITVSTGAGGSPASISQQADASKGGFAATISNDVARAAKDSEGTSAGSVPLTSSPHVHAPVTNSFPSESSTPSQGLQRNEGVEEESLVGGGGLAATIADEVAHAAEESPATSAGPVPLSSHPHVHPAAPAPVSRDSDYEQPGSVTSISRETYERPSDVNYQTPSESNTPSYDNFQTYNERPSGAQTQSSQSVDLPSSLFAAKTSEEPSSVPSPSEVERSSTQGEHGLVWDDATGKYLHRRDLEARQSQESRGGDRSQSNDEQSREARGELVEERAQSGGRGYEAGDVERAPEARGELVEEREESGGRGYEARDVQRAPEAQHQQYESSYTGGDDFVNLGLGAPVAGGGHQGPTHTTTTQSSAPPPPSAFGLAQNQSSFTSGVSSPSSTYSSVPVTQVQDSNTSFANVDIPSTRESESALDRADTHAVASKAYHHDSEIRSSDASAASIPGTIAPTTPSSIPAVTQSPSKGHTGTKESDLVHPSQIPDRGHLGEQEREREQREIAEQKMKEHEKTSSSAIDRKETPPSHASSVERTASPSSPASSSGHKKSLSEKFKGFLHKG